MIEPDGKLIEVEWGCDESGPSRISYAPHSLAERPKAGERFRWPHITPGYADLLASWVLYRKSGCES